MNIDIPIGREVYLRIELPDFYINIHRVYTGKKALKKLKELRELLK